MKNVILITMLTLMVLSCKKEEVKPNVCMECAVLNVQHTPFNYSCDTGSFKTYCNEDLSFILKQECTHVGDMYSYWWCKNK